MPEHRAGTHTACDIKYHVVRATKCRKAVRRAEPTAWARDLNATYTRSTTFIS